MNDAADDPLSAPAARTPRRDLLTEHPAVRREDLIVRWPDRNDGWLASGWAEAADRVAWTFTGTASDDALLPPYLYLYRHAFELELKHGIRYAARLRILSGDPDVALTPRKLARRLQFELRHDLVKLADALDGLLTSFDLDPLPVEIRDVLSLIGEIDRVGESFRYTGSLPSGQDSIDFRALHATLTAAYQLVSVTPDVLSQVEDALGFELEMQQELEQEMRVAFADQAAEYDSEYRSAYDPDW